MKNKKTVVSMLVALLSLAGSVQADYYWGNVSGDWAAGSTWGIHPTYRNVPSPTYVASDPNWQDIAIAIGDVTINVTTDGQGAVDLMMYHAGASAINVSAGKYWQITHVAQIGCGNDSDTDTCTGTINVYGSAYFEQLNVGYSLMDSGIVNVFEGGSVTAGGWGCTVGKMSATGTGEINLKGGIMTVQSSFTVNPKGLINIEKGTLKIAGDYRAQLQEHVAAGRIISRGGLSSHCYPVVTYADGYTYVKTGGCTCTKYLPTDLNHDCYVDLADLAAFAQEWLICYDSKNSDCEPSVCAELKNKSHQAIIPVPVSNTGWQQRHADILNQIATHNPVDLIFIGDSITQAFDPTVWNNYYASYNPLNLGFSGDMTQNVLWRLENGEITGISPKLAVILIGTNNTYPPAGQVYSAEEIADGIMAICCKVRRTLPNTKILLMAIFPRGEYPSAERNKNAAASLLASQIADNKTIYYMDINSKFIGSDGKLSASIFPDFIHPNAAGDTIWADAVNSTIQYLMGL